MAEKKSSGFKTFLLFVVVLVLAFFLGCGAFLILSPNSQLFGVSYVSHTKTLSYDKVGLNTINFDSYSKIVIDTTSENSGFSGVQVICGNTTSSLVELHESSSGYYRGEARNDYDVTMVDALNILTITVLEPEYNFIRLNKHTVLKIIINQNNEDMSNTSFEIKTNNGNIIFGGLTASSGSNSDFKVKSLTAESANGTVSVHSSVKVSQTMNLKAVSKSIIVENDINAYNVSLNADKGKISATNFTNPNGEVTLTSKKSHITINNIAGNCVLDTISGTVEIAKVGKDFSTTSNVNDSYVTIAEVGGKVSVDRFESAISMKIGKVVGEVDVLAGGRNIEIGDTLGKVSVKLTSGSIIVTKNSANNNEFSLESSNGQISATLNSVKELNKFKSTSGAINVKFNSNACFLINATSNGKIYRSYIEDSTKPLVDVIYGTGNTGNNKLNATSENGSITLGWI